VSSPVGLRIASELCNQEICGNSRFRNASIKSLLLRRQQHGNLNQSHDWNQITIATHLYTAAIECIVTDRITDKIPFSLGRDKFNLPGSIRLVDSRFHISSDIDLLIGMDLF